MSGRERIHPPPPLVSLRVSSRGATNTRLKNVQVIKRSDAWKVSHETRFQFKVDVHAESDARAESTAILALPEIARPGNTIGLVQTLMSSTRVATYENGGTLTIIPAQHLPVLDAQDNDSTIPFYDDRAGIKMRVPQPQRQGVVMSFTLDIDDDPSLEIPLKARQMMPPTTRGGKPQPVERKLLSLVTEETFYISLWNKDLRKFVAQWVWSYKYTIALQNGEPFVARTESSVPIKRRPDTTVPLRKPVAGADGRTIWTPGFSPIYNSPF